MALTQGFWWVSSRPAQLQSLLHLRLGVTEACAKHERKNRYFNQQLIHIYLPFTVELLPTAHTDKSRGHGLIQCIQYASGEFKAKFRLASLVKQFFRNNGAIPTLDLH